MYDSIVVAGAVAIIMSHPIPFDLTVVSSGYVYVYKVIVWNIDFTSNQLHQKPSNIRYARTLFPIPSCKWSTYVGIFGTFSSIILGALFQHLINFDASSMIINPQNK